MKRYLVIFATLATLALPRLVGAGVTSAPTAEEGGRVDASELADLLVRRGLITPQEEQRLTHPIGGPSVDERALQEYFKTPPYRREGWRGGA
jgi:hypothetical protein